MKIGLFIPCYMNELYPDASMERLKILESLGLDVEYPMSQTCCGQGVIDREKFSIKTMYVAQILAEGL
jgi:Fe-S oxidoreductase